MTQCECVFLACTGLLCNLECVVLDGTSEQQLDELEFLDVSWSQEHCECVFLDGTC